MSAQTSQTEIPPLAELVRCSLRDILEWAQYLSLPEILIVAAKPFDKEPRPNSEVLALSQAANDKLEKLQESRDEVLEHIIAGLRIPRDMQERRVTDYFEKYEFLTSRAVVRHEDRHIFDDVVLRDSRYRAHIDEILRDISKYRGAIAAWYRGSRPPAVAKQLQQLLDMHVNLRYLYNATNTDEGPQIIGVKTKADNRVASKIPYSIISSARTRADGELGEKGFRKHRRLEDGITKDNVGLQFVTLDESFYAGSYIAKLKHFIFITQKIEVKEVEEHGEDGPYKAIHLTAAWNETPNPSNLASQHSNLVEIQLMQLPYFISANFGPDSYLRRVMAQERGIVEKRFFDNGRRIVRDFTQAERSWKETVQERIKHVLTYARR